MNYHYVLFPCTFVQKGLLMYIGMELISQSCNRTCCWIEYWYCCPIFQGFDCTFLPFFPWIDLEWQPFFCQLCQSSLYQWKEPLVPKVQCRWDVRPAHGHAVIFMVPFTALQHQYMAMQWCLLSPLLHLALTRNHHGHLIWIKFRAWVFVLGHVCIIPHLPSYLPSQGVLSVCTVSRYLYKVILLTPAFAVSFMCSAMDLLWSWALTSGRIYVSLPLSCSWADWHISKCFSTCMNSWILNSSVQNWAFTQVNSIS